MACSGTGKPGLRSSPSGWGRHVLDTETTTSEQWSVAEAWRDAGRDRPWSTLLNSIRRTPRRASQSRKDTSAEGMERIRSANSAGIGRPRRTPSFPSGRRIGVVLPEGHDPSGQRATRGSVIWPDSRRPSTGLAIPFLPTVSTIPQSLQTISSTGMDFPSASTRRRMETMSESDTKHGDTKVHGIPSPTVTEFVNEAMARVAQVSCPKYHRSTASGSFPIAVSFQMARWIPRGFIDRSRSSIVLPCSLFSKDPGAGSVPRDRPSTIRADPRRRAGVGWP